MLVSRRKGMPLQIVVCPFVAGIGDVPHQVVATVYIRDPGAPSKTDAQILQSLYGLTRAEAKLAVLLLEGKSLSTAAQMNRTARETVRSQVKSIFQKTGTRRQGELIRLLGTIPS